MSQGTRNDITKKRVVYQMLGMDAVTIRRDVEYQATNTGALTMDIYYPPEQKSGARIPAVVFVSGYSDLGFQKMLGCKLKDMESYISWGRLTAASGMVAITYSATEPAADVNALLQYVSQNAASLGIDEDRIGVWACSGNVPNALSVLMHEDREYLKCGVLCYGMMPDLEESANVAELAKAFGFANPCAGKTVDDLPKEVPLFIVRAGRDPAGPHAFDVLDDSETSREIIRQILAFMRFRLLA